MADYNAITMLSVTAMTSAVTVTNTVTETTLHSVTLPTNIMSTTGRALHTRAWGTWGVDGAPPTNWTLRLKMDSDVVWVYQATPTSGTYTDEWKFDVDLIRADVDNWRCYGIWSESNAGVPTSAVPSDNAVATSVTGGAVVALTLEYSAASTISSFTCEMCSFEIGGLV